MSNIVDELSWRGLIAQSTDLDALCAAFDAGPVTYYCGFDPTAPSLHIGNLVQILTLRRLQEAGHRPLALVGGATGLIGDPKPTAERQLNDRDTVGEWVERLRGQIEPFLRFDGDNAAVMVNNLDWTAPLSAIDFLRDIGKHFRVGKMLAKEAVSARLASDAGISYTEFSYQILQAHDFLELYRRFGCTLQLGGSDQWGNLTAGTDLVHRAEGRSVHALGTPLITKADGTKFGKTESGTVWLDPDLTSPYAFYQFWLNAEDAQIGTYLRVFTDRDAGEVAVLEASTRSAPQAREAQRTLAGDVTTRVHGADATAMAVAASAALFGKGELRSLDAATLGAALTEAGHVDVAGALPSVTDLLVSTGLCESRSAARRAVTEGGAYVNNLKVTDPEHTPAPEDLLAGGWLVLRRGKRTVAGVRRT